MPIVGIVRVALTAGLIYWAVWLESKLAMTIFLALVALASEVSAAARSRADR